MPVSTQTERLEIPLSLTGYGKVWPRRKIMDLVKDGQQLTKEVKPPMVIMKGDRDGC